MFEIPRHIENELINEHVYHFYHFSDSSECAYAVVVYYVITSSGADILMSKTHVAPLKKLTILRLELCTAIPLTQVVYSIIKSTGIKFDSVNM